MVLAQQQFKYSIQLHSEDSISATSKDKIASDRFISDTIKQSNREKLQEYRNALQDDANKQQFALNKSQLKAVQIQAKIAEEQFNQQQEQYSQQLYEQRPIFTLDSVSVDSVNMVRSRIRFSFSNKGVRTAHVDSTVLAFYNPLALCFSVTSSVANLDLVPQKNFLSTPFINIYKDCLNSPATVYYLLIYYKDKTTGADKLEPIFFRYEYSKQHVFMWSRVFGPVKNEFIVKLKRKKILIID